MKPEQREELDRQLTTPPHDCEDDGHSWRFLGRDSEGSPYYKCRKCGQESDE